MFVLRDVSVDDLDGLHRVAAFLNSVNLPNDRAILEKQIDHSRRSFAGQLDVFKREYLFVLVDTKTNEVIGTSMIHAQHGTRRAPHIFFDVMEDERYSESLDRHFVHKVLRIGYNFNGPTEIGGLVLHVDYRHHPSVLGKWLSYVRFLYMALHRERFRDDVISELMPPLEADGTSLLWESVGRHFTGLSYQEADRVSQTNKEFIRTLFPAEPIYLSLFPKRVQEIVGQVGPTTKGVEKMLRQIGFEYAKRIDPFDGGPHFIAKTDQITLVQETTRKRARVGNVSGGDFGLLSIERDREPHFAATGAHFRIVGDEVELTAESLATLGAQPGELLGVLPFEARN
jgi:arginine N-succinyltransferase